MELETGVDGVTTVVYTQEPTPFGALISQRTDYSEPPT
jgi:hypothetical protein